MNRNPHWGRFTDPDADPGMAPARPVQRAPNETLPNPHGAWLHKSGRTAKEQREDPEVCPDCREPVRFSTDGRGHLLTLDPTTYEAHECPPPASPRTVSVPPETT